MISVQTPAGPEAVLDGDCDDVTQVIPPEVLIRLKERCMDPFWITPSEASEEFLTERVILPPPGERLPLVRIPTPLPGRMERVTERPNSGHGTEPAYVRGELEPCP